MYVRFVVTRMVRGHRQAVGIFTALEELLAAGELTREERAELEDLSAWFDAHLPLPHVSRRDPRAIYWFQPSATEHLRKARELANLLELHDYTVARVTAEFAGLILYSDDFQVGALPRSDAHRRRR
jgi:hypothetical protein